MYSTLRLALEDPSSNQELKDTKVADIFRSGGGAAAIFAEFRQRSTDDLHYLAQSLGVQPVTSGRGQHGLMIGRLVDRLNEIAKLVSNRDISGPCHWCRNLVPVRCSSCSVRFVHHGCMLLSVPVISGLGDRLCRLCAEFAVDRYMETLKADVTEDLKDVFKELNLPFKLPGGVTESRSTKLDRLRLRCRFNEHTPEEVVILNQVQRSLDSQLKISKFSPFFYTRGSCIHTAFVPTSYFCCLHRCKTGQHVHQKGSAFPFLFQHLCRIQQQHHHHR